MMRENKISGKMFGAMLLLLLGIILAIFYPSRDFSEDAAVISRSEKGTQVSRDVGNQLGTKAESKRHPIDLKKAAINKSDEEEEGC
ncbi:hypothetical protein MJD09_15690 [bacterium]|nr:hypothetical protein [bacterium]